MRISVIPGDGIGPEITAQAVKVLEAVGHKCDHNFEFIYADMGGIAIDKYGVPLPEQTINICKGSDCVLLGAVGGPKWDTLPGHLRPEKGLLGIRSALGLYANLRPATLHKALRDASPLRPEVIGDGFDIMFVRELTGGMYFGERGRTVKDGFPAAYDTELYNTLEIERIGRKAFELAKNRNKRVCSVDKANVLESSRLWREVMEKLSGEYPDIAYSNMLVDNAAMQLVRNPCQFDVIVTSNMFGDILSDEASMITGSIGMLPSASLGDGAFGLYEPIHGSAPDIAGMDKANPIATILSIAMLLRVSLKLENEADMVEQAVQKAFDAGYRTGDIMSDGNILIGTRKMGDKIAELI